MWYAPIEPYERGVIETGDGHEVYWELAGNPSGSPVLVVHGGPGGGSTPSGRRWFDPRRYRIIQCDQRGCGRSTPHACITRNTTAHLIDDMEALRERLQVERWMLMGRSWGTTLALAYAESHPDRVSRMVLVGVFTARRSELDWLYRGGAAPRFPVAWDRFCRPLQASGAADPIAVYYRRLTCGDEDVERQAARSWCAWEHSLASGDAIPLDDNDATLIARARLEAHYFANGAFFTDGQLLANAEQLRSIPGVVIQGEDDFVTPPRTAAALCATWPRASLRLVPGAGHQSTHPEIMRALVGACDE
jgi:proline iminopeptidase